MRKFQIPLLVATAILAISSLLRADEPPKSVLFVCEHGAAKSVMAASFFNRMAEEQKLNFLAICRGTSPDAEVSAGVVAYLKKEGIAVAISKPQALAKEDADAAVAIVAFCEIPRDLAEPSKVVSWAEIPWNSSDYEKAKAFMLSHIAALIAELKAK
jgi:arsenate reductase (thioredoxin)